MAGSAGALLALAVLASLVLRQGSAQPLIPPRVAHRDQPGQPTVDSSHIKTVTVACSSPYTLTQLTSPVFDSYLAALGSVFTESAPLLFNAHCRAALYSGIVTCLFSLDTALQNGALQLLTNLQGYAGLDFAQCAVSLDGGTPAASATCWADANAGDTVAAASPIPETLLGPTLFVQTLVDLNPAVGGTKVGAIDIRFACKYL